jgi:hypothetical protein
VALGYAAYAANNTATGSYNIAIGDTALAANTTGSNNTAVGFQAAYTNTTGAQLVAIGTNAMVYQTVGRNVAMGYGALSGISGQTNTGIYNTAIGTYAGNQITTGSSNVAIGDNSMSSSNYITGNYNVGIGNSTFGYLSSGNANVAVGLQALANNTTASYNTALGYQAGYSVTTDYGNTFIGNQSGYSFNKASAGSYTNNTFVGISSGYYVTTGAKNTIIGNYNGNQGGLNIISSSNYIVLSDGDGNPIFVTGNSANTRIGTGYTVSSANPGQIIIQGSSGTGYQPIIVGQGNGSNYWTIGTKGNIDSSTNTSFEVQTGGTGGVYLSSGGTSWTAASDSRLKNVTGTYTQPLTDIAQIQAVKFTWKSDATNKPQVGVIAQSVQNVVPEAIDQTRLVKDDETEYLAVRYTELIPLMIASIQELNTLVTQQATQIAALQSKGA